MAKVIAVTVPDAAHLQLSAVQKRMTEIRQAENPKASKANQADALSWILVHTRLPGGAEDLVA